MMSSTKGLIAPGPSTPSTVSDHEYGEMGLRARFAEAFFLFSPLSVSIPNLSVRLLVAVKSGCPQVSFAFSRQPRALEGNFRREQGYSRAKSFAGEPEGEGLGVYMIFF